MAVFSLGMIVMGCKDATEVNNVEVVEVDDVIETPMTYKRFIASFPTPALPWSLPNDASAFDAESYSRIPAHWCADYLNFNPHIYQAEADSTPVFAIARWSYSDTSDLIAYMTVESHPVWEVRHIHLSHLNAAGKQLGHFRMGQWAFTKNHQHLKAVEILQTPVLTTLDSGTVTITTYKTNEEVRREKYIFAVAADGTIDAEFVIKETP